MVVGVKQYERLLQAVAFYKQAGFKYIDVPWDVSPEVSALTKPEGCKDIALSETSVLVASAEQSFLQMYDEIPTDDIYMSITPCFRDEPTIDEFHQRYFMKLEIFSIAEDSFTEIIYQASRFFTSILGVSPTRKYSDEFECDLMLRHIELGSYGIRFAGGISYAYGTGIAEPRMTQAIDYKKSAGGAFIKNRYQTSMGADEAHEEAWELAKMYLEKPHLKNTAA